MQARTKTRVCLKIREDIEALGSDELEELAWLVVSLLECRDDLLLRGHDEKGNFIKGVVDAFAESGEIAIECGAGAQYFSGSFDKPVGDVENALSKWPNFERLYLFSTHSVPPTRWGDLRQALVQALPESADPRGDAQDIVTNRRQVFVYDSRRTAEKLFELLCRKTELIRKFELYLPFLATVMLDLTYDNAVPATTARFLGRESLILDIRSRLLSQRVCVLYGISGTGKTEVAAAVAGADGSPWPERIWIDASSMGTKLSFASVPIDRIGRNVNLLGRIKEEKTVVVIDDWHGSAKEVSHAFLQVAHDSSVLLVTSQVLDAPSLGIEVMGLDRESARRLLELPGSPPPEHVLDQIVAVSGGNPLVLWLLRDLVEQRVVSWLELQAELGAVSNLTRGDKTVAQHIFERHAGVLGKTIPALGFLGCATIEPTLLRSMIGSATFAAARDRGFLRITSEGLIRVHDLVRAVAAARAKEEPAEQAGLERVFWEHIERHLPRAPYHIARATNLHRTIIARAARANFRPGLAVRTYFNVDESAFDDAAIDYLSEQQLDATDWAASTSVLEAMERRVRRCRVPTLKKELCSRFACAIEQVATHGEEGSLVHTALLHHAGKLRYWGGDLALAAEHFRRVLVLDPDYSAARLQLARILVRTDVERAQAELRTILLAARDPTSLATASVSVLLAAFQELGEKAFDPLLEEFLLRDPTDFKNVVQLAVAENFAHPYTVVARLMVRLGYRSPQTALRLLDEIALPEPANDDEPLNRAAGLIELGRHDALRNSGTASASELTAIAECALRYFRRVEVWPDPEEQRHVAKTLNRLGKHNEELDLLAKIPPQARGIFVHYDMAKAYRAVGRGDDALKSLAMALDGIDERTGKYRATFLRLEALLHADAGRRAEAISSFRSAIAAKPEEPFDAQLLKELGEYEKTGRVPGKEQA